MEWVDELNRTIRYMEEHLTEEIRCGELAKIACCSAYHYQRMFAYLAGLPLSEYIRRRRMSLAAVDLLAGEKVVDVALKYGYQSPTAFNRAFQAFHGIAPSAARDAGAPVKSFSPLHFTITVKGAEEMEYRVEKREAFRIVGVSHPLDRELEKNFDGQPAYGPAGCECLRRPGGVAVLHRRSQLPGGRGMGDLYGPRGYLGHLPGEGDRPVPSGFGTAYCHRMAAHLRV